MKIEAIQLGGEKDLGGGRGDAQGTSWSEMTCSVPVILQFYSAVFFDNGSTIQQHFVVEFHNIQLLLQWSNHCLTA